MSKELTTVQQVCNGISAMREKFAVALPSHIKPDQFERAAIMAVQTSPEILDAERSSLYTACLKAAQDGLIPDGREAALVVFNKNIAPKGEPKKWAKVVQYMPMYSGVLKKIRQSGELASISSNVVYERDFFDYVLGDFERIEHKPCTEGDAGKPKLVYAIARMKDGAIYREVMTVAEIEQVRAVSKAKDAGPWVEWWGEMAKKTVTRRLSKRLPLSTEIREFLQQDDVLVDFSKPSTTEAASNLNDKIAAAKSAKVKEPKPETIEATVQVATVAQTVNDDEDFLR